MSSLTGVFFVTSPGGYTAIFAYVLSVFFSSKDYVMSEAVGSLVTRTSVLSVTKPSGATYMRRTWASLTPGSLDTLTTLRVIPTMSVVSSGGVAFLSLASPVVFVVSRALTFNLLLSVVTEKASPSGPLTGFLSLMALPGSKSAAAGSSVFLLLG